ncbi:MAG: PQQ-binding-like beta-propeller repeat protein [Ruminococcus sp.]
MDGQILANTSDYTSTDTHSFDAGISYTDVDGIVTFRGNNFRDTAAYGNTQIKNGKIQDLWTAKTGSITYGDATWSGSGWTGQPLMEKWSQEVKKSMNMYDWAKEKDDLVEVIYACMDGYVYFLDLETGEATRDPLYLGFTFKGAGALDPRGYPIMYVGAGYDSNEGTARVFVVNLLDCSVMYTFGNNDEFSLRGNLSYFDSSALVDAATDTLIYPGENGILYLIKLNTSYDPEAGTLSINPDHIVKWRYYGTRTSVGSYWLGMEDSAAIYDGYLFIADNGGNLMCLNLNTLQLVWVQDVLDDSNSTPVLSVEDGHLYLYVSTSFRLGWRSSTTAEVPVWKIDAETGEIIWQTSYDCSSEDSVSGGVQSTIAVGKEELSDNIYVTVARTGGQAQGVLACIDKNTGKVNWEHESAYAWSSPVCVYNPDGSGKVLYCNSTGHIYLLDGKTGDVLDCHQISEGVIEASPAIYQSYMVVGTRDCKIWGMELQ